MQEERDETETDELRETGKQKNRKIWKVQHKNKYSVLEDKTTEGALVRKRHMRLQAERID